MSDDRVKGAAKTAAGAVKEGLGKLTGDAKLNVEGKGERAAGSAQNAAGKAQDEPRRAGPDPDRVEGSAKKLGGSVKEGLGKLTGDAKLTAEGRAEKTAGGVQNAVGGAKDTVRDAFRK